MTIVDTGAVLLIVVVGWAAYINSFQVPFVYDDLGNIVTNSALETFKFGELSSYTGTRSLPGASLAINYRLGGLNVFGYHVVNWVIHIINGLLIYWLCLALSKQFYPGNIRHVFAVFVSLIFVTHPLATEAVTYVIQRTVSMTVLFYLLALTAYVQWRVGDRKWWAFLSVASTLLAMHSKQISFTIPLAIGWLEFCFFSPSIRELWRRLPKLLPWLIMLFYLPWWMGMLNFLWPTTNPVTNNTITADITGSVDVALAIASGHTPLSPAVYLMTQFGVLITYIKLLFFPAGQSIDHAFEIQRSIFNIQPMIGLMIIMGLIALMIYMWPKRRVLSFGIGLFFIGMIMESSVLPLLEVVAEYRLYLPLAGFALVLGDLLMLLYTKVRRPLIINIAAGLVVLALTVTTFQRNIIWNDPLHLWQDAIAKAPDKARPHNNLGTLLLAKEDYEGAADQFKRAVQIDDKYAHAHSNLGTVFGKLGRLDEAITQYQKVIELNPDITIAAMNMSVIYVAQKKYDEAARQLEAVIVRDPYSTRGYKILAAVYARQNKLGLAAAALETALEINPDDEGAYQDLELVRSLLSR